MAGSILAVVRVAVVKRVIPWLLLALAVVWHVHELLGPTWERVLAAPHARDFASYFYAVQAADVGRDPYDMGVLSELARADGTRGSVHPFFYPPPFLLTMVWALPLTLEQAYHSWYVLDSLALVVLLLGLYRWLPGPGTVVGMAAVLAVYSPIHDNHWMGQANLPVLAAVVWALLLARDRPRLAGFWMGLACMMKMSPGLLVAWWLVQRRWLPALWACVWALVLSVAALPLVDLDTQARFFLEILPGFGTGDYNGLTVPILLPGNHSLPNLFAQAFDNRRVLTEPALSYARYANLGLMLGSLLLLARRQRSQLGAAAAAGAISVVMLLVPVYTYEHHLTMAILPVVAAAAAIADGRLGRVWAGALALAFAALAWPWGAVKGAAKQADGHAAWALIEAKFFALVVLGAACLVVAWRDRERDA